ncbi:hypothetical protein M0805_005280 [Coniferiporia weirii]|nr:hypothetical protein M0805_005280 [Coniferiporia weirii]
MNKEYSPSSSLFETLAPESISRIALYMAIDDDPLPGPPSAILPLALTSRTIAHSLSLNDNSPLLSEVFRLKFDHAAAFRRLGTVGLTTVHLSSELRRRCRMLKRIRAGCLEGDTLLGDLWSAFLMMLENDGMNEKHLLDWANLPGFLVKVIRNLRVGGGLLQESQEVSLAVWLVWMSSNYGSLCKETSEEREVVMSSLQPLVVAGHRYKSFYAPETFFWFAMEAQSSNTRELSFPSPLSDHAHTPIHSATFRKSHVVHFGRTVAICAPPVTLAAFLATTVRLDFDQQGRSSPRGCILSLPLNREAANVLGVGGPTLADMAELASSTRVKPWTRFTGNAGLLGGLVHKMTSDRHDQDWRRITLSHDYCRLTSRTRPFKNRPFVPGQLSGLWAGKLMVPDIQAYRTLLSSAPGAPTEQITMYQRPLYMRLREHHCFITNTPVSCGSDNGEDNDFLNAWLPKQYSCVENQERAHLNIFDPVTRRKIRYETFVSSSDGIEKHSYPSMDAEKARRIKSLVRLDDEETDEDVKLVDGINDIVVTGETDPRHGDAWGHYRIVGRVRPSDGLVVFLRKPRNPEEGELGTWVFRGYVISSGTLVGRWRESTTVIDSPTLEGPFVMTKQ